LAKIMSETTRIGKGLSPPVADILMARGIRKVKKYSGRLRPFTIVPFLSYGCDRTVVLCGRVIENLEAGSPKTDDPWWVNLRNMTRVFFRARAEEAEVKVRINGESVAITSDAIGYFQKEVVLNRPLEQPGWVDVEYRLERISGYATIDRQRGRILSLPLSAYSGIGIISDIDDTILETYATDLLMSAKMTFINNCTTRIAIAGMASLYQTIIRSTSVFQPVFYITSSSWSLYGLMSDFLDLQSFPRGPLLMQKIGMTNNKLLRKGHAHKIQKIEKILDITKNRRFILIGDNGQADRQIYHEIANRYPHRIAAVCIRKARKKSTSLATDYDTLGIPYFEFEDGFILQDKLRKAGLLDQP